MRTVMTVSAPDAPALVPLLDDLAGEEYRAGRAGTVSPPQWGQTPAYGELWLMAVARPAASFGEWIVYAITSEEDVPGWPSRTGEYTGGIRTAADIARPLAAAGNQVVLRHYAAFAVTSTAQDVPLT